MKKPNYRSSFSDDMWNERTEIGGTQVKRDSMFVFAFVFSRNCDGETCMDTSDILYAWARNAPPTRLPKGMRSFVI